MESEKVREIRFESLCLFCFDHVDTRPGRHAAACKRAPEGMSRPDREATGKSHSMQFKSAVKNMAHNLCVNPLDLDDDVYSKADVLAILEKYGHTIIPEDAAFHISRERQPRAMPLIKARKPDAVRDKISPKMFSRRKGEPLASSTMLEGAADAHERRQFPAPKRLGSPKMPLAASTALLDAAGDADRRPFVPLASSTLLPVHSIPPPLDSSSDDSLVPAFAGHGL